MKKIFTSLPLFFFAIASAQYWNPVSSGTSGFIVNSLALDSANDKLYIGGGFATAGGVSASNIAVWNGSVYAPVGIGSDNPVRRLELIDGVLYAGGEFTTMDTVTSSPCIARYNGTNWEPMGQGFFKTGAHTAATTINAIAKFNNEIYVAGVFDEADGVTCNYIARWDSNTWQPLGNGIGGTSWVYDLEVFDSCLYVAGSFTTAGGVGSTANIAKWNGTTWSAAGGSANGNVFDLQVHDGELYAVGAFSTIGGTPASKIAKWNGFAWSAVGSGMNADANSLVSFNGDLYAGGIFTQAGGNAANRVAKWDGLAWTAVGSGMNNLIYAFEPDEQNNLLYACGSFTTADANTVNHIAVLSTVQSMDEDQNSIVKIYPQPATDEITFEFEDFNIANEFDLKIFDVSGKEMNYTKYISATSAIIDIHDFNPGIYIAVMQNAQAVYSFKFVKQ